jgi:RNA:NAD 2'-phosphotransferase (TPT1/KptA family)
MKTAILITLALAAVCTTGATAQDQNQDRHDQQATSHRVRKTNVRSYVRKDGDNYVVEDDRNKTRYRVQNTEAIREHEGHHVQVNARLHEDDRSLEVNKVKRLNDEQRHDH